MNTVHHCTLIWAVVRFNIRTVGMMFVPPGWPKDPNSSWHGKAPGDFAEVHRHPTSTDSRCHALRSTSAPCTSEGGLFNWRDVNYHGLLRLKSKFLANGCSSSDCFPIQIWESHGLSMVLIHTAAVVSKRYLCTVGDPPPSRLRCPQSLFWGCWSSNQMP